MTIMATLAAKAVVPAEQAGISESRFFAAGAVHSPQGTGNQTG